MAVTVPNKKEGFSSALPFSVRESERMDDHFTKAA